MSQKLLSRMQRNARYLIDNYDKSETLLRNAMQEAMPWATALYTQGKPPQLPQLERLATQLLAILIASEPEPKTTAEVMRDLKW